MTVIQEADGALYFFVALALKFVGNIDDDLVFLSHTVTSHLHCFENHGSHIQILKSFG